MHDDLTREIELALEGLSQIEKALYLAASFREVYGNEWIIEAKDDGGFRITEALPEAKKTL